MVKVKNLTNSPYDLQGRDGPVRIPAFGEAEGEFTDDYLMILEASGSVVIVSDTEEGGQGGGSKPPADDLAKLRADYLDVMGKKPFNGWSADQLREKIDAKLAE